MIRFSACVCYVISLKSQDLKKNKSRRPIALPHTVLHAHTPSSIFTLFFWRPADVNPREVHGHTSTDTLPRGTHRHRPNTRRDLGGSKSSSKTRVNTEFRHEKTIPERLNQSLGRMEMRFRYRKRGIHILLASKTHLYTRGSHREEGRGRNHNNNNKKN